MRIIKPTSRAIISGILATISMAIMKIPAIGIASNLSWWIIMLPIILIVSGLLTYVAVYFGRISYKERKYMRQKRRSKSLQSKNT